MRLIDATPQDSPTTKQAIGRWALPAAFLLAVMTMGSAHGTQAPSDHAAEFDAGAVCASSPAVSLSGTEDSQLDQLVISTHAASVHAAR